MTEAELANAEEAIELLAEALKVTESEIVTILKNGMEFRLVSLKKVYEILHLAKCFG